MRTVIRNRWEARQFIENCADFHNQTGSFSARTTWDGAYVVYSYATPIVEIRDGVAIVNDTRYSITTSQHMGIARQGLPSSLWGEHVTVLHVPYGARDLFSQLRPGALARFNRLSGEARRTSRIDGAADLLGALTAGDSQTQYA